MADKARTPPPPRKVQAPKVRASQKEPTERNRLYILLGATALAAVAVAVGLALVFSRGGGGSSAQDATAALSAAGCTFKTYPNQGRRHVTNIDAKIKYNSFPPTSGPHYESPAPWNTYPAPISQVQGVHNLEHGGILIQYGSTVPAKTVDQLTSFVEQDPRGMLLAPLPGLGAKVALTAWTHLATCTRFEEKAYKAFRSAYRGKGPEGFPLNSMQPGQ